jgi:hydrophobic/amphiphilic exporter-1 (mainly G- bacteria), HAE1 family
MNWLSRAAVNRRSVTILLAAALFVGGIVAWASLKQELLPPISFPVATVIAPYPGAAAEEVVDDVVVPIESAVRSLPGLETVNSTSANSIGFVIAQYDYGIDVDEAVADLEDAVAGLTLPDGVEPVVTPFDINQSPVVIASISSPTASLTELGELASERVLPELRGIAGVATAEVTGGLVERVEITLDPIAVARFGIGLQQLHGALAAANLTVPAGELETEDGEAVPVTVQGEIASVEALRDLVVGADQSGEVPAPITLAQIATVEIVEVPSSGFGRINGDEALGLTVSKSQTANTVDVSEDVRAALDELVDDSDGELVVSIVSDQSDFIIESRDGLLREGGLGALFAILTIFAFLFSLRSTIVAALSIPLSLLVALIAMQFTGITINIMTLGGLAVAVGRVVDDSIVVLENIYRHRAIGDDRLTASIKGPSEVASAITSSTLTTVAVFLPLGLAGGFVSQFFLPFALTVTFALLASLVVALTVVPVLAYLFVGAPRRDEVDASGEPRRSIWVRAYDPTIRWTMASRRRAVAVVVVAFALFVGSLFLVPLIPTQFINSGSEKLLTGSVAPPSGASSEAVRDRVVEAEEILLADDEVELLQATVPPEGDTGFGTLIAAAQGRPANSAQLYIRLDSEADLEAAALRLDEALASLETDGWEIAIQQTTGAGGGTGTSLVVSGADDGAVEDAARTLADALEPMDGLANVTTDLVAEARQVVVRVDPARAAAAGVAAPQVAGIIGGVLSPMEVGAISVEEAAEPLTIVVRFPPGIATSVDDIRALPVGAGGMTVGDVAEVSEVEARPTITRVDGAPSATVSADITDENTGAVTAAIQAEVTRLDDADAFPPGTSVAVGGVSEQLTEAFGGLFVAMAVAILLVYLMLVLAFNSLITPFVILFSLPLATIGAFPALLLTGRPIGISALIGFLMLIGIVVTNAIVLLDLVERLRGEGVPLREAIIRGGHTRVRPILMTAIATIFALVPLAAGLNEGSIIAAELGTVVIGGLLSSTFLTLIVVPAAYRLIEGWRERRARTD